MTPSEGDKVHFLALGRQYVGVATLDDGQHPLVVIKWPNGNRTAIIEGIFTKVGNIWELGYASTR